ncbi:hypothetical protein AYO47_06585 [Planctomyces sp. SCGC AG-212-M04]|nr:hypothetical protein AYO47_06585 [Planctomyces sp. SCGC AG-212-M04]
MALKLSGRFYPLTFQPLAATAGGRAASQEFDIPPFVDGSIRREPDLEHTYPSISCLCRANLFAPRLEVGDLVAYMTTLGKFGLPERHRRLIAVLQVWKLFDSHLEASNWYRSQGLPVPSNCMVKGNRPLPLSHTVAAEGNRSQCNACRSLADWDADYRERAELWGRFVVCKRVYRELTLDAPVVRDSQLMRSLGEVPQTRNPRWRPVSELAKLLEIIGLSVQLPGE